MQSETYTEEKLLAKGSFSFSKIEEDGYRFIEFSTPLEVWWCLYQNPTTGHRTAYVDYDFGLSDTFCPYQSIIKGWRYDNITTETQPEEIIRAFVKYDLFHAFFHYNQDPNYTHLHWALYGNLKDRVKLIDGEDISK